MSRSLEVVVGAQYGSEAKGHVVQRLTERAQQQNKPVQVLRVAGPNAGHTGYDADGRAWALRQIPVAAVTGGSAVLGIAAGSEIDLQVLLDEYDLLKQAGLLDNKFLWVSGEATLITNAHQTMESGLPHHPGQPLDDLVGRIGSTGKGIGAARADRLMRRAERVIDNEFVVNELVARNIVITDSGHKALSSLGYDQHMIIEGTQGFGLGLRAGHYPQCTSSDCRAIDFMAMAGINPWEFDLVDVWAVARIYPIRVAGNSGPLANETTWEELGLPEERTTVTKKVRRVGGEDWDLVRRAVLANGGRPTVKVALTMVDQKFPHARDRRIEDMSFAEPDHAHEIHKYVQNVEGQIGAPINMITTGPNTASFL